jgi:hypothetical protein
MADQNDEPKDRKHRSPAYPFISLEKAVERAQEFYDKEHRHSAPPSAAAQHWGYATKSSAGMQTISALKQFGLLAYDGVGADRRVKLTERAFRILLDEVKDSQDRATALKQAALAPVLYAEMFKQWGVQLPSDETIRTFLRRDRGFNDDALETVINSYKDTLEYAKLAKSDTVPQADGQDPTPAVEVAIGDYVQWESQGALQFDVPRRVVGLSAEGTHVFVEGTATGLPMEQVSKTTPPSHSPGIALGTVWPNQSQPKPATTLARDVYTLEDGEAIFQYPTTLSPDSVEELERWLALIVTKLKRLQGKRTA